MDTDNRSIPAPITEDDNHNSLFAQLTDPHFWERPPQPVRIVWSGLTGKTGRAALQIARTRSDVEIVGGISRRSHDELATLDIAGETFPGIIWNRYDEFKLLFSEFGPFDVIVDFSHVDQTEVVAQFAAMLHKPLISGTAGLAQRDLAILRDYAGCTPIFRGGNFQFAVKQFIDQAVEWGIEHPDETLYESFFKGKIIPSQTYEVILQRVYAATGQSIGVRSSRPYDADSLICDWRFGNLHCRTVGFADLASNVLDIAKVMKDKPAKPAEFYDLDELWPDLQPSP